jgi:archaellum biogenesis protein FlaJ (TadC family)
MTNSSNSIDDVNSIINYKNKRNDFYENRYNFYLNSIEALKNEKYLYYYLSILYFLCVVLLLISLIIILIFGHSINAIIITSVLSFLIALMIVYYIYFKLHHHTRLKINKNYWAYNNPSNSTISDLSN